MNSVVEPLEGNKVKVSVTVDAGEFEAAIDAAWRQIAREVKVPGFRAGKVPRKVLEARVDPQLARSEALQKSLPDYYVRAVIEHDVDAIDQPDIDITAGEEGGDVAFDAVVQVRPSVAVSGYENLTVTIPSPMPTDDDISDQLDRLRAQYGELTVVDRPAATGDFVTIDIATTQDGAELEGMTADDYLYEVGAGNVVAELDEQLRGLKVGEIVEFEAPHPDPGEDPVSFRVLLKEVKERILPDLTDEWVTEATEFATVDELRDDIMERLGRSRKMQASMALQSGIGEALAGLVADPIPDVLIGAEMRVRLEDLVHRLSHQGLTLDTYLNATGIQPDQFSADLRESADQACRVDLALRAIVAAEELAPSDEELDEEIERLSGQTKLDPEALRAQLQENGQLGPMRSELGSRKAMRWVSEQVSIVDTAGTSVRREELTIDGEDDDAEADDPSGDHDHNHAHTHD